MTDQSHSGNHPGSQGNSGAWQPVPGGGDYDPDQTMHVSFAAQLPPEPLPGEDPLGAHGPAGPPADGDPATTWTIPVIRDDADGDSGEYSMGSFASASPWDQAPSPAAPTGSFAAGMFGQGAAAAQAARAQTRPPQDVGTADGADHGGAHGGTHSGAHGLAQDPSSGPGQDPASAPGSGPGSGHYSGAWTPAFDGPQGGDAVPWLPSSPPAADAAWSSVVDDPENPPAGHGGPHGGGSFASAQDGPHYGETPGYPGPGQYPVEPFPAEPFAAEPLPAEHLQAEHFPAEHVRADSSDAADADPAGAPAGQPADGGPEAHGEFAQHDGPHAGAHDGHGQDDGRTAYDGTAGQPYDGAEPYDGPETYDEAETFDEAEAHGLPGQDGAAGEQDGAGTQAEDDEAPGEAGDPDAGDPLLADPGPDGEPGDHAGLAGEQAGGEDASGAQAAAAAEETHSEHPLASYMLRVNGADRPVTDAWLGESLLYVLRERLGLAGAKDGCEQGECGACSVQVDGRLVASCLVPAATAAGSEVRTVEGLTVDGRPSDVQRALADCGAVQCGFCIPGMAMTVHDLLEGNHRPTELDVRHALSGNLCRCSGYRGVLDAVRQVVADRGADDGGGTAADDPPARVPHQGGPATPEADQ